MVYLLQVKLTTACCLCSVLIDARKAAKSSASIEPNRPTYVSLEIPCMSSIIETHGWHWIFDKLLALLHRFALPHYKTVAVGNVIDNICFRQLIRRRHDFVHLRPTIGEILAVCRTTASVFTIKSQSILPSPNKSKQKNSDGDNSSANDNIRAGHRNQDPFPRCGLERLVWKILCREAAQASPPWKRRNENGTCARNEPWAENGEQIKLT